MYIYTRVWWTLPGSISFLTTPEECGTFSNTVVRHGVCVCEVGYMSGTLTNGSGCGACPGNKVLDVVSDSCACAAGYESNSEQTCAMCEPGSHKTSVGDTACTPCPKHTHVSMAGARVRAQP